MRTINQTLKRENYLLGGWMLWTNDVLNRLDKLRITPKTKIPVVFTPSEYTSENGYEWECLHASTTPDTIEHYDHYMEAVTGLPQMLSYEKIDVCDSCNAWYSYADEEWHHE